ncbi:hypothetical protein FA10DRAFT_283651 [Acaromyces ingoldii]|uniref:Uncharacterized protein n=1 Tax=Acaromyces ingoldii TaxID=215250 RepID=A0A316Z1I5_9BASI|nr:hypothetical protein FA10DRAFT_283651 [Acaromyces ingoldii]PWN94043.1 hypothetical protein FA10DRAFT_283651 [Acaromyces ingoldii]
MTRPSLDRTASKREKVNAVSKASLAMFNPAYAMGIESGPTWLDEHESMSETHDYPEATPELEAFADADGDQDETDLIDLPVQPRSHGHAHTKSVFEDDGWAPSPTSSTFSGSSASSASPTFGEAAGLSRNSTVKLRKQPGRSGSNASSNSLSRFFSWKRAQNGSSNMHGIKITKHGGAVSTSPLMRTLDDQPRSAPPHIESFEAAQCYAYQLNGPSSLPGTPLEATQNLPALSSSSSSSSANSSSPPSSISGLERHDEDRSLGRKHSMPSLREVRSKNACHLGKSSFSSSANEPFYWRDEHFAPPPPMPASVSPRLGGERMLRQVGSNSSNGSNSSSNGGKSSTMTVRPISRISSVGKGAIRKSMMPLQLNEATSCASPTLPSSSSPTPSNMAGIGIKSPKSPKSTSSKSRKRFDPVNSPEMPSLPLGATTLAEAVEQGLFGNKTSSSAAKTKQSKDVSTHSESATKNKTAPQDSHRIRRRSRSVGAQEAATDIGPPRFSTMFGLPETTHELDLEAILAPSSTLSNSSEDLGLGLHGKDDIYGGVVYEEPQSTQDRRTREASNGGGETPKLGETLEDGNSDDHWGSPSALVARRVQLNHGGSVVGVSSPKLVSLSSPRMSDSARLSPQSHSPSKLGAAASSLELKSSQEGRCPRPGLQPQPVLVNVMPPTPDLGAGEEDTFEGETPSPSVLRTARQEDQPDYDDEEEEEEDEEVREEEAYSQMLEEQHDPWQEEQSTRNRSQSGFSTSTTSDGSSSSSLGLSFDATLSQDEDEYEPFGFARSLSSSSLASSVDSDASENESAQIMVASSASATFEKATFLGGASPSSSSGGGSNSSSGSSVSPTSAAPSPWSSSSTSTSSFSSGPSSVSSSSSSSNSGTNKRASRVGLSTLSSGQSLASVMTTSTSILDFGMDGLGLTSFGNELDMRELTEKAAKRRSSDLFSPAEIRGLASQAEDEDDCDTPRLSGGNRFESSNATTQMKLAGIQPTRPLQLRKNQLGGQDFKSSPAQQGNVLSTPSSYRIPRGQSASSPHLELDLSLPLDLDDLGLGLGLPSIKGSAIRKSRQPSIISPPKPPKSAARRRPQQAPPMKRTTSAPEPDPCRRSSLEPKTPPRPSATTLQNPPAGSFEAAFGLGLGLALDLSENSTAPSPPKNSRPPSAVGFAL